MNEAVMNTEPQVAHRPELSPFLATMEQDLLHKGMNWVKDGLVRLGANQEEADERVKTYYLREAHSKRPINLNRYLKRQEKTQKQLTNNKKGTPQEQSAIEELRRVTNLRNKWNSKKPEDIQEVVDEFRQQTIYHLGYIYGIFRQSKLYDNDMNSVIALAQGYLLSHRCYLTAQTKLSKMQKKEDKK